MQTNDILPEGAGWVTPYLTVTDVAHSLQFYRQAFGFSPGRSVTGPGDTVIHAEMTYQGQTVLMFAPEEEEGATRTQAHSGCEPPLTFYVYCANVDWLAKRAREAGAIVLESPRDAAWGDRIVRLQDPDGYRWTFATRLGEGTANAPA